MCKYLRIPNTDAVLTVTFVTWSHEVSDIQNCNSDKKYLAMQLCDVNDGVEPVNHKMNSMNILPELNITFESKNN